MLSNQWLHAAEHVSFLLTAIMFWTLVIEPSGRRRMGYIPTMLFVAAIVVLSGLPGALMILPSATLFSAHGHASVAWGLTPLEDQQIAGVCPSPPATRMPTLDVKLDEARTIATYLQTLMMKNEADHVPLM